MFTVHVSGPIYSSESAFRTGASVRAGDAFREAASVPVQEETTGEKNRGEQMLNSNVHAFITV